MQMCNGVAASSIPGVTWVKSSASAGGNCVELAAIPGGSVAMRNSRDPEGPALIYTGAELEAFVAGAKAGEFDGFGN
ncbi:MULTISPECIES: DUF397 domain-containing protein [Streptomyces]|uniref:DUF397 domain-containing protein n=1 Tax=Streptomyces cremeus TaxID=66881 RepID=A0ABV5PLI8_STRCM